MALSEDLLWEVQLEALCQLQLKVSKLVVILWVQQAVLDLQVVQWADL